MCVCVCVCVFSLSCASIVHQLVLLTKNMSKDTNRITKRHMIYSFIETPTQIPSYYPSFYLDGNFFIIRVGRLVCWSICHNSLRASCTSMLLLVVSPLLSCSESSLELFFYYRDVIRHTTNLSPKGRIQGRNQSL